MVVNTAPDHRLAIAYIRKSRVIKGKPTASYEVQKDQIDQVAHPRGDIAPDTLAYMSDWNRSGTDKNVHRRLQYQELLAMIRDNQVRTIYGYDISRLTRGMKTYVELVDLCRTHDVAVLLSVGGEMSLENPEDEFRWNVIAAQGAYEARKASQRQLALVEYRRKRGDQLGGRLWGDRPGEDVEILVAAFEAAGSINGASRILNAREHKVPTRNGIDAWHPTVVKGILNRLRPGLIPPPTSRGRKPLGPYPFFALLQCHCGAKMFGRRGRHKGVVYEARYACAQARNFANHHRGRHDVKESEIKAYQDRVETIFLSGRKPKEWYENEMTRTDSRLRQLEWASRVTHVPTIDWSAEVTSLNQALRAVFEYVELDEDLRPVRAAWRNERLRRTVAAA
jgi:DNA invertase Pin-like site-specific DNA recombinase